MSENGTGHCLSAGGARQRPPRTLSAEQQLMFDIRSKVDRTDNRNRVFDLRTLKETRQRNQHDDDLLFTFSRTAGGSYGLDLIKRLHEMLIRQGVERPSEIITSESIKVACEIGPALKSTMYSLSANTEQMVAFTLAAGSDCMLVGQLIKARKLNSVDEIKAVLAEVKMVHPSLASGAL